MIRSSSLARAASLFRNVGGRTFLEPKALFVFVAPLAVHTSLVRSEVADLQDLLGWSAANIFAMGVIAVPITLFYLWRSRRDEWQIIRPSLVLLLAFAIGGCKSFLTIWFMTIWSPDDIASTDIIARLIASSLGAAIYLPLVSLAALARLQFENERQTLISLQIRRQQIKASQVDQASSLGELAVQIQKVLSRLAMSKEADSLPASEVKLLRELVDKHIRPLTSRLFERFEPGLPAFSWSALFRSSIESVPVASVLAVVFLSATSSYVVWFGLAEGLFRTLATAALIYVAIKLGGLIPAKSVGIKRLRFVLVSFFGPILAAATLSQLLGSIPGDSITQIWLLGPWYFGSAIVMSMVGIALERSSENREDLLRILEVGEAEIDAEVSRHSRERKLRANQLHGEVQSRLMSIVLQEQSIGEVRRDAALKELGLVLELIETPPPVSSDLNEKLEKLRQVWSGFAKIDTDIDSVAASKIEQSALVEIIEEALSNAFRHGLATEVFAKVSMLKESVVVRVIDNGLGPVKGVAGAGTSLFDQSCDSWHLTALENGGSEFVCFPKRSQISFKNL